MALPCALVSFPGTPSMRSASRIVGKSAVLSRSSEERRSCSPCPCAYTAAEQNSAIASAARRAGIQRISGDPGPGLSGRWLKSSQLLSQAILWFPRLFWPPKAVAAIACHDPPRGRLQHPPPPPPPPLPAPLPPPPRP